MPGLPRVGIGIARGDSKQAAHKFAGAAVSSFREALASTLDHRITSGFLYRSDPKRALMDAILNENPVPTRDRMSGLTKVLASAIGVAPRAINEIIHARRSITTAMSIRFGAFFGQSSEFWHGIQIECDFRALAKGRRKLTAHIQPAIAIAHAS